MYDLHPHSNHLVWILYDFAPPVFCKTVSTDSEVYKGYVIPMLNTCRKDDWQVEGHRLGLGLFLFNLKNLEAKSF